MQTIDPELQRLLEEVEEAKRTVANYEAILKEERDNLFAAKEAVNAYHRARRNKLEEQRKANAKLQDRLMTNRK